MIADIFYPNNFAFQMHTTFGNASMPRGIGLPAYLSPHVQTSFSKFLEGTFITNSRVARMFFIVSHALYTPSTNLSGSVETEVRLEKEAAFTRPSLSILV